MKILAITVVALAVGCKKEPPCLRSHSEVKTRSAWTQIMFVGKTIVPIYHPQSTYTVVVCEERAR